VRSSRGRWCGSTEAVLQGRAILAQQSSSARPAEPHRAARAAEQARRVQCPPERRCASGGQWDGRDRHSRGRRASTIDSGAIDRAAPPPHDASPPRAPDSSPSSTARTTRAVVADPDCACERDRTASAHIAERCSHRDEELADEARGQKDPASRGAAASVSTRRDKAAAAQARYSSISSTSRVPHPLGKRAHDAEGRREW